jgi:hypothetical protein
MSEGLLRWRQAIHDLQKAAADGLFGGDLRLYQLHDGTWQLLESVPEQDIPGMHRLEGNRLFINEFTTFGDREINDEGETEPVPVDVGGRPCNDDPPPFLTLSQSQMQGPTTVFISTNRLDEFSDWNLPASVGVSVGVLADSGLNDYFRPAALIVAGKLLTVG